MRLCYYHSYYGGEEKHLADAIRLFDRFTAAYNKHDLSGSGAFIRQTPAYPEGFGGGHQALQALADSKNPALDQLISLGTAITSRRTG